MELFNKSLGIKYYTIEDCINIFKEISKNVEWKGGKKNKYADLSASFDIESSSFYDGLHKRTLMYVWQFGIQNPKNNEYFCFIGREWEEFRMLINTLRQIIKPERCDLKANYFVPIYVHNLSFEFSFLRPIFSSEITEVFSVKSQSPLYVRMPGIEFRCSYLLSGCALQYLPTKQWTKKKGDLDYTKLRTPQTHLTDKELGYCLADVLVLCEYITNKREQDGGIDKVKRTKTGYARAGMLEHCLGSSYISGVKEDYTDQIKDLYIHSSKEYKVLNSAFQGGHTTACPWYSGRNVYDVTCYDFTSSYPAVMVCENRFPRSFYCYRENLTKQEYEEYIKEGYAIVSRAIFKNVKCRCGYDDWIPSSKITTDENINILIKNGKCEINNGKVHSFIGKFKMFITNIDYEIYRDFYNIEEVEFSQCYIYKTGYLPKPVVEYVLSLYKDKTVLKGVKGQELYYQLRKELLNALYGMSVTDICKDETIVNLFTGEWSVKKLNVEDINEKLKKYNDDLIKGKISSPYIWGIYISALARYNLHLGIIEAGNKGLWCYADTDSIYVKNADLIKPWIEKYNKNIKTKMEAVCKLYGLKHDDWCPKSKDGKDKPLGYWDFDGHFKVFKTLGAKRYMKLDDNNQLHITVAGLGKKQGCKYLENTFGRFGAFKAFDDTLEIPKGKTGKMMHTILTEEVDGYVEDYLGNKYHYKTYGGTHLEDAGFNLNVDSLYLDFLLGIKEDEIL